METPSGGVFQGVALLVQLPQSGSQVILACYSEPSGKFLQGRALLGSGPMEHEQGLVPSLKIFKDDRLPVYLLDYRYFPSYQVNNDALGFIWVHIVVKADQLSEYPVHVRDNKCRILKVWINTIAKVSHIAFVTYVVDEA